LKILVLFLLIGSVVACPPDEVFRKDLKMGLFGYLNNPAESILTIYEVKDLITLYLTADLASADCTAITGAESHLPISIILDKIQFADIEFVPRCSDGTIYGECSSTKPKFCYSGTLKEMCSGPDGLLGTSDDCGCSQYQTCLGDGTCYSSTVPCVADSDCGTETLVGTAQCNGMALEQDYIDFTCVDSGLPTAYCDMKTAKKVIDNCSQSCGC